MSANLKAARKSAGMTQEQAADASGIPVGTIRRWEQGRHEPDIESIIRLAKVYGVTTDTLLGTQFADTSIEGVHVADPDGLEFDERECLSLFRELDEFQRVAVLSLMRVMR